jgi:hypothetical protein
MDTAYGLLDKALAERDSYLANILVEPFFAPLRSDPRYAPFVKKMGLRS